MMKDGESNLLVIEINDDLSQYRCCGILCKVNVSYGKLKIAVGEQEEIRSACEDSLKI